MISVLSSFLIFEVKCNTVSWNAGFIIITASTCPIPQSTHQSNVGHQHFATLSTYSAHSLPLVGDVWATWASGPPRFSGPPCPVKNFTHDHGQ